MKHSLPQLPYALNALTPHMSEETLLFHYEKHHQAYINNLNTLIVGTSFEEASLEEIIGKAEGSIFNNGAQAWNHSFFFLTLSPLPQSKPTGELLQAIEEAMGSLEKLQEEFNRTAAGLFGSGWCWLVKDQAGKLSIRTESNAGNPLRQGFTPLLTADIWEHAYYIDYRNRRPDFLSSFWNLVDWAVVEERYKR